MQSRKTKARERKDTNRLKKPGCVCEHHLSAALETGWRLVMDAECRPAEVDQSSLNSSGCVADDRVGLSETDT